jgi:hypothetical protein
MSQKKISDAPSLLRLSGNSGLIERFDGFAVSCQYQSGWRYFNALQLGHRISVDLDLFGLELPDRNQFLLELNEEAKPLSNQDYFYAFEIGGVKIDVLRFHYPLIRQIASATSLSPKKLTFPNSI